MNSVERVSILARSAGTRVVLADGFQVTFIGRMPKAAAIRQAEWHRDRGEKSEVAS